MSLHFPAPLFQHQLHLVPLSPSLFLPCHYSIIFLLGQFLALRKIPIMDNGIVCLLVHTRHHEEKDTRGLHKSFLWSDWANLSYFHRPTLMARGYLVKIVLHFEIQQPFLKGFGKCIKKKKKVMSSNVASLSLTGNCIAREEDTLTVMIKTVLLTPLRSTAK